MEEIQEERSYSRWEWFFYMIFVPALFASLLGGVLLSLLGVNVVGNVLEWANKVPFVEKLVPDSTALSDDETMEKENSAKQVEALQLELAKNKEAAITAKEDLAKKEATILAMDKQIKDLQKLLEDKRTSEEERQKQFADLAKVYTTMSAKNAAAIVENLSKEEAIAVLAKMKPDQRASILAKMDPKKAADLSILVKDTVINKDDDIAALQQRVQILTKALSDTRQAASSMDSLIQTFSQMPSADSAKILSTLMKTNQSRAVSILAGMGTEKRAEILSGIAKIDEQMAARITSELLR